jgi:hypothetical protein
VSRALALSFSFLLRRPMPETRGGGWHTLSLPLSAEERTCCVCPVVLCARATPLVPCCFVFPSRTQKTNPAFEIPVSYPVFSWQCPKRERARAHKRTRLSKHIVDMPCGLAIRSLASNLLVASSSRSPSSSSFVAHRVGRAYKSYSTETTSSVFPACGRKRGVSHGSLVVMASLPQGKGAAELVAQSCAALGACSR